jgi:preprotein translocase subunit SecA
MARLIDDANFFVIPDLSVDLNTIEKDAELNEHDRLVKKRL